VTKELAIHRRPDDADREEQTVLQAKAGNVPGAMCEVGDEGQSDARHKVNPHPVP